MGMLRYALPGSLLLLLLAGCGEEIGQSETPSTTGVTQANYSYVPGEILVGVERPAPDGALRAAAFSTPLSLLPGARLAATVDFPAPSRASARAAVGGADNGVTILKVALPPGQTVADAIATLSGQPGIRFVEANRLVRRAVTPNDPFLGKQWWLNNYGQTLLGQPGKAGADISASLAWDLRTVGSVPVAVLDSGIDLTHPDLAGNLWNNPLELAGDGNGDGCPGLCNVDDDGDGLIDEDSNDHSRYLTDGVTPNSQWRTGGADFMLSDDDENGYKDDLHGWNFVSANGTPQDDDSDGHGSHGSGIVGALGNNGVGVSGIGWTAQLMSLKFLNAAGSGGPLDEIEAIKYAVDNGAKIINASYTYEGNCLPSYPSASERAAIDYARQNGVLFVAAAGNFGCNNDNSPFYPASHTLDNIIAVAASDSLDRLASWGGSGSNYGPGSVDLAAPGHNIYSTIPTNKRGSDGYYGYGYLNGTSMAAPMVSGAAALLWSHNPTWTYAEVRDVLLASVDPVEALAGVVISGGRLNLARALQTDINLTAPNAPTGLLATAVAADRLDLQWTDQASNETGYLLERSTDGGATFVAFDRIDGQTTTYADTTVPDGRQVNYRVKALAGIRSSVYSNQLDVMVPLLPPANPGAVASNKGGIVVLWDDRSTAETSYRVERLGPGETVWGEIASLPAGSTSYADLTSVVGSEYRYRVRAYNPLAGYSAYCAEVAATRPAPSQSSGCFIATAAWGSPLAAEVASLRAFRDRVLLESGGGRLFVAAYYRLSPSLAASIAENDTVRGAVRTLLYPLVWLARAVTPGEANAMGSRPATVAEEPGVVPGELLVGLRPGLGASAAEALVAAEGGRLLKVLNFDQKMVLHIALPAGMTVATARERFAGHPEVEYAEANRVVSIRPPIPPGGGTAPRP